MVEPESEKSTSPPAFSVTVTVNGVEVVPAPGAAAFAPARANCAKTSSEVRVTKAKIVKILNSFFMVSGLDVLRSIGINS